MNTVTFEQRISSIIASKRLWLQLSALFLTLFFISLPYYSTEALRLSFGGVSIAPNMIVLAAFLPVFIFHPGNFMKVHKDVILFMLLVGCFVLYHLFSAGFYGFEHISVKYLLKLIGAVCLAFITYQIFRLPEVRLCFQAHFRFMVHASALLLGYYILLNLFLGNEYLTFNYMTNRDQGKNQIEVYIGLVLPLFVLMTRNYKSVLLQLSLAIHFFAAIYVGSRGLWVSLFIAYLITMNFNLLKAVKIRPFSIVVGLVATIFLSSMLYANASLLAVKYSHIINKMSTLVQLKEDYMEKGGPSDREYLLRKGWSDFIHEPIFGGGLGSFESNNELHKMTHNDYLFFLTDLGILGLMCWLLIMGTIFYFFLKKGLPIILILPFFFGILFINAYTFPLFWVLLGILFALGEQFRTIIGINKNQLV